SVLSTRWASLPSEVPTCSRTKPFVAQAERSTAMPRHPIMALIFHFILYLLTIVRQATTRSRLATASHIGQEGTAQFLDSLWVRWAAPSAPLDGPLRVGSVSALAFSQ